VRKWFFATGILSAGLLLHCDRVSVLMLEKEHYFCSNTNRATGLADKSAESLSKAIARLVNRALFCRRSNGALRSRGRIVPLRGRTRAHRTHACMHVCTYLHACTSYELYVARAYTHTREAISRASCGLYVRAFTRSATRARLPGALEILSSLAHANHTALLRGEAAN